MKSDNYEIDTNVTIAKIIAALTTEIERLEEMEEKSKQSPQKIQLMKEISLSQRLAILFYIQSNILYRMLDINDAISKLPDKKEFEGVKT